MRIAATFPAEQDNPPVRDFDTPRRVNGLRHNPRQFCSMAAPGYVARDVSRVRRVMKRVNPAVGTGERLRDFRPRSAGGGWQAPTRERARCAGRDQRPSGVIAKSLRKLAIETKTPPGLSDGVSR